MKPLRHLRAVAVLTVIGSILLFATSNDSSAATGSGSPLTAPTAAHSAGEKNTDIIDFNNPTELAWSLQLGAPSDARLHDLKCTHTTGRLFTCTGLSTNGEHHTEELTVSRNGGSWVSR